MGENVFEPSPHSSFVGNVVLIHVPAGEESPIAEPQAVSTRGESMRYLAVLFATLGLAACSTAPVTRSESQAVSPTQVLAPELQKPSIDSVVQFLLQQPLLIFVPIAHQILCAFVMCALATL